MGFDPKKFLNAEQLARYNAAKQRDREKAEQRRRGTIHTTPTATEEHADVFLVSTLWSLPDILGAGGSGEWTCEPGRAGSCEYLVVCRSTVDYRGPEPQHSAFLIGRISCVVPGVDNPERSLVKFSEYALIDIPDVWPKNRLHFHYTTVNKLGIDPALYNFTRFDEPNRGLEGGRCPSSFAPDSA